MTPLQNESDNENWQMLIKKKTQKQTEGATCSNTQDATHEALKPENKKKQDRCQNHYMKKKHWKCNKVWMTIGMTNPRNTVYIYISFRSLLGDKSSFCNVVPLHLSMGFPLGATISKRLNPQTNEISNLSKGNFTFWFSGRKFMKGHHSCITKGIKISWSIYNKGYFQFCLYSSFFQSKFFICKTNTV